MMPSKRTRAFRALAFVAMFLALAGIVINNRYSIFEYVERNVLDKRIAGAKGYYYAEGANGISAIYRDGSTLPVVGPTVLDYRVVDGKLVVAIRRGTSDTKIAPCEIVALDIKTGEILSHAPTLEGLKCGIKGGR